MDIQIAFRNSGETLQGRNVYSSVGLVRARKGTFEEERVSYFGIRREGSEIREISLTGMSSGLDLSVTDRLSCDLGNLLTSRSWRLPVQGEVLALFLRQCRVEAGIPDYEVLSFSGMLLVAPGCSVDEDAVKAFSGPGDVFGRPDLDYRPEGGLVALSAGNQTGSVLKMPLWGFSGDRVGLPGTLNLKISDELDVRRLLGAVMDRDAEQEAVYQRAGALLQPLGLLQNENDDTFMAVIRHLAEHSPEMLGKSSKPLTAADMELRNDAMTEALRAVMPSPSSAFR